MIIHNDASSPARVLKTGDKADNQKKINATLLNFCTFVKKISTPTFSATGYLAYGIKI